MSKKETDAYLLDDRAVIGMTSQINMVGRNDGKSFLVIKNRECAEHFSVERR